MVVLVWFTRRWVACLCSIWRMMPDYYYHRPLTTSVIQRHHVWASTNSHKSGQSIIYRGWTASPEQTTLHTFMMLNLASWVSSLAEDASIFLTESMGIRSGPNTTTRNSSEDEIANVNFLYDDIVHALQNAIDSCINSDRDRRGHVLERSFTKVSEITQCNGHYAVQGHSRSPILVLIESSYAISYYWLLLTYLLSCTVSK